MSAGTDLPTLGVLVTTLNHEKYISKCLQTVREEFPVETEVVVIDAGSADSTVDVVAYEFSDRRETCSVDIGPGPTCGNLVAGLQSLKSDYVCLISGDDFFLAGYHAWVQTILGCARGSVCLNPALLVFRENPKREYVARAKWTGWPAFDRFQLYVRNAGRGPGAVVPRLLAIEALAGHEASHIEDLMLWYGLVNQTRMISGNRPLVAYRVHDHGQTSARPTEYIWSLGYCLAVNLMRSQSIVTRLLTRLNLVRTTFALSATEVESFARGYSFALSKDQND